LTPITAAVVREPGGPFEFEKLQLDKLRDEEILVRIVATGICHTDIGSQSRLPMPVVLGHEGAGIVERVGRSVTKISKGDSVVLTFGSCGICPSCLEGAPFRCDDMGRLQFGCQRSDGGATIISGQGPVHGAFFQQSSFATHALATERNTIPVASNVALHELAPLACGIQTGAGAVMNSLDVRAGESLAVFGVGSVGLSAVMAARVVGAQPIIAIDVHSHRLDLACDLGATHKIDARDGDVSARVRDITSRGVNYSLETSASEQAFNDGLDCLAMGGACAIVTVPHHGEPFPFAPRTLVQKSAKLIGVLEGASVPNVFIPRLIELYRTGRFPIDRLITTYPFAEINQAVADSQAGTVVKPVLLMPTAS